MADISAYVVSAICGNWWQESTLNPGLYEGRKVVDLTDNNQYGGYGLGQWTNAPTLGLTRRTALINWLRAQGYADDSGPGQIAFFRAENTWYRNGYGANFSSLSDFLSSDSTDLQMLTYAFLQGWEGIWDGTEGIRYQGAVNVYNYLLTVDLETAPTTWYVSNQYLSNDQRLNNALQVWRVMSGDMPVPPGPPVDPDDPDNPGPINPTVKTSKIWQWIRYK